MTLTGKVGWMHQKREAERAVRHIRGVREVVNRVELAPRAVEKDVRHRIVEALHRNADLDAHHITLSVSGDIATLTGSVSTWSQRDAAEGAAAHAPGIAFVDNLVCVAPRSLVEEHEIA